MADEFYLSDWPLGLACLECGEGFEEGDPLRKRLVSFRDETPVVEIICDACERAALIHG